MDHAVNELCAHKFDEVGEQTEEVRSIIHTHGEMLQAHSTTLDQHGQQLHQLEEELRKQGELLMQNQTALATLVSEIAHVKGELIRMNTWQVRLIFLLAAAVIAIAGVTKLADVGAF